VKSELEEREVRVVDVLDEATMLMLGSIDLVVWADSEGDREPVPPSTPSTNTIQNL